MGQPVARLALTDQVYKQILDGIFDQTYRPGQQLTIQQLADQLNVSSTPVREALSRLASAGIVELNSFKGFRVGREMDVADIRHLFDVRILLETAALQYNGSNNQTAVQQMIRTIEQMSTLLGQADVAEIATFSDLDRTFHRTLLEHSGNPFLVSAYQTLDSHIHIGRLYLRNRGVLDGQRIVNEHQTILDNYRKGNVALTQAVLRAHLEAARERVIAFLRR